MDYQNRPGGRTGTAAPSAAQTQNDRRERLRKLALETIDLAKDPYFLKNHLGSYECKLCLTLHINEGSYLSHTQAKKHQTNLAMRAAKELANKPTFSTSTDSLMTMPSKIQPLKTAKIGRPGYKVTKIRDGRLLGMLFQIQYPNATVEPRHRFMSSFEQKVQVPDKNYQYLLFAAEPYETVAFKIQSKEIDKGRFWTHWDSDSGQFHLQLLFRS